MLDFDFDSTGYTLPRQFAIIDSGAARAVGRFRPEGVLGYRATNAPDAPLRSSRDQAIEDEYAWRALL
jgi:hypothetical protein